MICMVCGGDHQPSSRNCTDDGMNRVIAKIGARRWNEITAGISRVRNKDSLEFIAAIRSARDGGEG